MSAEEDQPKSLSHVVYELRLDHARDRAIQEERWRSQDSINERQEEWTRDHETRISALERKVAWFAGISAGVGAFLGALLQKIVGASP